MVNLHIIEELILNAISSGIFPGAVVCLYKEGEPTFLEAYGMRMLKPYRLCMLKSTLFDLASLTKPIATATSILILYDQDQIDLNKEISFYLPEFRAKGITVFHLLTHTSGLPAWRPIYLEVKDRSMVIDYLGSLALEDEPGKKVIYSCLGYILLGEIVRKVTGVGLDIFATEHIFRPLGMNDTFFNPPESRRYECAGTEDSSSAEKRMTGYRRDYSWRDGVIVGEVHDENAHFLGGVSGNAGLFSTAQDLLKFCKMLIRCGDDILSYKSIELMTTNQTPGLNESRSIGWIIKPNGCLYHTGFTGASIQIDMNRRAFAILLTNRVHPDATKEGILGFRTKFYKIWEQSI